MDKIKKWWDTKKDLVYRKGVINIITTYHQLSAIDRNIKFNDPNRDHEFICSNHHDNNSLYEPESIEFSEAEFFKDDL